MRHRTARLLCQAIAAATPAKPLPPPSSSSSSSSLSLSSSVHSASPHAEAVEHDFNISPRYLPYVRDSVRRHMHGESRQHQRALMCALTYVEHAEQYARSARRTQAHQRRSEVSAPSGGIGSWCCHASSSRAADASPPGLRSRDASSLSTTRRVAAARLASGVDSAESARGAPAATLVKRAAHALHVVSQAFVCASASASESAGAITGRRRQRQRLLSTAAVEEGANDLTPREVASLLRWSGASLQQAADVLGTEARATLAFASGRTTHLRSRPDLVDATITLSELLGWFLFLLVEDARVLFGEVVASRSSANSGLGAIANDTIVSVLAALEEIMRIETGRVVASRGSDDRVNVFFLDRGQHQRLCCSDATLRLIVCSQCNDWERALQLTQQVLALRNSTSHTFNRSRKEAEGTSFNAREDDADDRMEHHQHLTHEVLLSLLYVLAQHGCWNHAQRLWQPHKSRYMGGSSTTNEAEGMPAQEHEPIVSLLLTLALVNSSVAYGADVAPRTGGGTAEGEEEKMLVNDKNTTHSHKSCLESSSEASPLLKIMRVGMVPDRAVSIIEYFQLLKELLLSGASRSDEDRPCSGHTHANHAPTAKEAADMATREKPTLDWALSPASVWRRCLRQPLHVRTAMCLLCFQVAVRSNQTERLLLEDVYVMLGLVRRYLTHHVCVLSAACAQRHGRFDSGFGDDGGSVSGDDGHDPDGQQEVLYEMSDEVLMLSGALPAILLPARRTMTTPCQSEDTVHLCRAYCAAQRALGADVPAVGSAVLSALAARELLGLLLLTKDEDVLADCWEAALIAARVVLTPLLSSFSLTLATPSCMQVEEDGRGSSQVASTVLERVVRALIVVATRPSFGRGENAPQRQQCVITSTTAASRENRRVMDQEPHEHNREGGGGGKLSKSRTDALEALVEVASVVPPSTVFCIVSAVGSRLTSRQCLRLLPSAAVGSRTQARLIRLLTLAQQRQHHHPAGDTIMDRSTGAGRGEQSTAVTTREAQVSEGVPLLLSATQLHWSHAATMEIIAAATRGHTTSASGGRRRRTSGAAVTSASTTEQEVLQILLASGWAAALAAFVRASHAPRVQLASAPYIVRRLVASGSWSRLSESQLRPLVRLAVRSSSPVAGGGAALAEDVLRMTLRQGMWHAGLHFHEVVCQEQPELLKSNRRALEYATLLCEGLLKRTAMAKTVVLMTQASRRAQWAQACVFFLRYAAGVEVEGGRPAMHEATQSALNALRDASVAPHAGTQCHEEIEQQHQDEERERELLALASLLHSQRSVHAKGATTGSGGDNSRMWGFSSVIPEGLTGVAHTVRYAMLHTTTLWQHALDWFPPAALPVPLDHLQEMERTLGHTFLRAHGLSIPSHQDSIRAAATPSVINVAARDKEGLAQCYSLVEAVRNSVKTHRQIPISGVAVLKAVRQLRARGQWEAAVTVYDTIMQTTANNSSGFSPTSTDAPLPQSLQPSVMDRSIIPLQLVAGTVLAASVEGGAPWQVTLRCFAHASHRTRPNLRATTAALRACATGQQWEMAFLVLKQNILTNTTQPPPRLVDLAVSTALHCGVWARALQAASRFSNTRNAELAHTILSTYVRAERWNDAVEYFYDCTVRGLRPLDASLELALEASEAASEEYRHVARAVAEIASALEDLYSISGAVLDHIVLVHQHWQMHASSSGARLVPLPCSAEAVDAKVSHGTQAKSVDSASLALPVVFLDMTEWLR